MLREECRMKRQASKNRTHAESIQLILAAFCVTDQAGGQVWDLVSGNPPSANPSKLLCTLTLHLFPGFHSRAPKVRMWLLEPQSLGRLL